MADFDDKVRSRIMHRRKPQQHTAAPAGPLVPHYMVRIGAFFSEFGIVDPFTPPPQQATASNTGKKATHQIGEELEDDRGGWLKA
jgi:hypothetical protein